MICKSRVDTSTYMYKTLKNGVKALLVHNDMFSKASCALTVLVGSYDEPDEYPGLAHFLEHMLFMGTAKFPGENMFSEFLSQHNGYSNAYTDSEHTTYYCDVDACNLYTMAEMFSQFFISPLFKKDSVERETSAVDSEYLNSINNHDWRVNALCKEMMVEGRVECRFNCGNIKTLRKEGSLEAVVDLWKSKYSGDKMGLVICGNQEIEALERVAQLFEDIPVRETTEDCVADSIDLFRQECLGRIVQYRPLDDRRELTISTVLPALRSRFRTNELEFISFLMTKREKNSLLSKLKVERLAFDLDCNYSHQRHHTIVEIHVGLTQKGFEEIKNVLGIIGEFLNAMKADKNEYTRLGRLMDEEFAFQQIKTPIDIAEQTSPNLLFYPPENVLNHNFLCVDFDRDSIEECISMISDRTRWLVLLSNPAGSFASKEEYYGVEYKIDTISFVQDSDRFINNLATIQDNRRYLKSKAFDHAKIALVFDGKFNVPKASLRIILSSPDIRQNPLFYELYFAVAEDIFKEQQGRHLTNMHVDLSVDIEPDGIEIAFDGFSAGIIEIAADFLSTMHSLAADLPHNRFETIRQRIEDEYADMVTKSPFRRVKEVFLTRSTSCPDSEEMLAKAKSIRREDIRVSKNYHMSIIAVGNINFEDLENLVAVGRPLCGQDVVESKEITGPVEFESIDQNNNAVALLYKVNSSRGFCGAEDHEEACSDEFGECDGYDRNTVIGDLVCQLSQEKFFNDLRTVEELGYVVSAFTHSFQSAEYLIYLVQSEKSVEFLEKRIYKFVSQLPGHIQEMEDSKFEDFKESLASFYEEPILNLQGLTDFVLNRYSKGKIDLNCRARMAELARRLSKQDVLEQGIFTEYLRVNSRKSIAN